MWKLVVVVVLLAVACTASAGDQPVSQVQNNPDVPVFGSQAECETAVIERARYRDGEPVVYGGAFYSLQNHEGYASVRFIPRVVCERMIRDQRLHLLDKAIIHEVIQRELEGDLSDLGSRLSRLDDRINCVASGRQYC